MEIKDLPAYKRLEKMFLDKGYSRGIKGDMPIYSWDNVKYAPEDLTPGHYVYARMYDKIGLKDVPEKYRTRGFFLHSLSSPYKDIVEYVRSHPAEFDKQFFKDHIATTFYGLEFELNDFEYMPLKFIDEEMVACAMFESIDMRYVERRGDCEGWFYSVYKRKPEVLTQDLYILGARCFAKRVGDRNKFLEITPEKYRTPEFYFALCLANSTAVMEDIPENILTTNFLVDLLNDSTENICCFSETALEREAPISGKGNMKFWQAAVTLNGYLIGDIPLNDERVAFFLSIYDKDSPEYRLGFKRHYKEYLRNKNSIPTTQDSKVELAGMITLAKAMSGMEIDSAIDAGNEVMNNSANHNSILPIHYHHIVPEEYCKKYDSEEYLLEIYKKLGIQVLQELDCYYYSVIFPEDIFVTRDSYGYSVKDSNGKLLMHYCDCGPFYDRKVAVDKVNVSLS